MARKKKQQRRKKNSIREQIARHVEAAFPGCRAVFQGKYGRAAPKFAGDLGRNFGFRVQDQQTGKYRSNVVWLNRSYGGHIGEEWVREAVEQSNGQ